MELRRKINVKRHQITQPADPEVKLIPLTKRQEAIVDAADYETLNRYNWYASWSPRTKSFYVERSETIDGKKTSVLMHRQILRCAPGEWGDHANHNTLDNRRRNLRKSSPSENSRNRKVTPKSRTGLKGASFNTAREQYEARIRIHGRKVFLGYFDTALEAANAYDTAARSAFGELAAENFPKPAENL